jgi:26S proteasome regulatory subunit N11
LSVRIVSERKMVARNLRPPEHLRAHYWLSDAERERIDGLIEKALTLDVYVSTSAEARMRNHALSKKNQSLEVMGFLLGELRSWSGKDFVVVRDVATTDLDATSVSVRFDRGGFEKLFESLDDSGFDYLIVGWYHSHPGYGCFLSEKDLETQARMFASPFHLAVVIDPKGLDIAVFKVVDGKQETANFAVYWDEHDDPYGGVGRVRTGRN